MNSLVNKAKKLFVDSIKIKVRGGKGGHGLPQYGGIGGKGGDVYVKGTTRPINLKKVLHKSPDGMFIAGDGMSARRTRLLGEAGTDLVINVPLGVTIEDLDRQHIGEINEASDQVIVAMGGRGGDKYNDNQGYVGQSRAIRLDLKLISDAVFVGFPNAGKSSLLNVVSRAHPKVAEYPFTTLKPELGTIQFEDYRRITLADLPGLVEGAHKNLGLGHEFLKHIVRSKLLVFLITINNTDLGPSYASRTPLETLCILNKEIELYDDTILDKPAILALNKMDLVENPEEKFNQFKDSLELLQRDPQSSSLEEALRPQKLIQFDRIIPISTLTGYNIKNFKKILREVIDKYAELSQEDKFTTYKELQPMENNRLLQ